MASNERSQTAPEPANVEWTDQSKNRGDVIRRLRRMQLIVHPDLALNKRGGGKEHLGGWQ
jgi:hypothetical protein